MNGNFYIWIFDLKGEKKILIFYYTKRTKCIMLIFVAQKQIA